MARRLLPLALPLLLGAKRPPPDAAAAIDALADLRIDTSVALVDPGAEPRAPLTYRPKIGARADYEVTVAVDMGMSVTLPDGTSQQIPMAGVIPPIVTVARNTVGKPVSSGHIPVRVEYLDLRVGGQDSDMAAAMSAGLADLKGMKFDLLIDPATKRPVQVDLHGGDATPELATAMQSVLDQFVERMVTFPNEPVGVGASWTIATDMSVSGLSMLGTETVTVRDISKNAVKVDLVLDLGLGDGGLQIPGMPPGAAVEVTEFVGAGQGAMTIDRQTLTSVGALTIDLDMEMKLAIPGQGEATMRMTLHEVVDTKLVK